MAIEFVFPSSYHRFCMRHFYANVHKYWKGILLKNLFWSVSRAYTRIEYDEAMENLGQIEPAAREYKDETHPR